MLRGKKSFNISVATSCASVEKKKVKRQQLNVKTKKLQRIKVPSMPYVVFLHPPIIPTTKTTTKKEVFWNFKLNILQRTREWDTSGLHQSISLKGAWELASSQWSSRITMGVQREDRREERRERERGENYLNLTTFHQCAVELFPGFLRICAGLKCHKAETLWYTAEVKEVGGELRGASWGIVEKERGECVNPETLRCTLALFKR